MTRLQTLRQRAQALSAQIEQRLASAVYEEGHELAGEPRDFTTEEQAANDTDQAALDKLATRIAAEERLASVQIDDPSDTRVMDGDTPPELDVRVTRDPGDNPFGDFGEQLLAIRAAALDPQSTDPRLTRLNQESRAATGQSETSPADGGFAVQTDFQSEIRARMHSTGQILQRVRFTPISANANGLSFNVVKENSRADGSRAGGIRGYWKDEAAQLTASTQSLRKVELKLKKLTGLNYDTGELMQDAAAFAARVKRDFADELRFKAEDAFFQGDGAARPLGILGHTGTISVAKETNQAATTIVFENIQKMWSRMRNRMNAVWMINQDCEPQLNALALAVGTGGGPAYMPAGGLSQAPFATLMGRPVIPIEYAPTLGTVGDITLCDWDAYEAIEKGGMQQATSMHVRFLFDEEVFRIIWRLDGQPLHNSALTPYQGSNTQAHFVNLATRS